MTVNFLSQPPGILGENGLMSSELEVAERCGVVMFGVNHTQLADER